MDAETMKEIVKLAVMEALTEHQDYHKPLADIGVNPQIHAQHHSTWTKVCCDLVKARQSLITSVVVVVVGAAGGLLWLGLKMNLFGGVR